MKTRMEFRSGKAMAVCGLFEMVEANISGKVKEGVEKHIGKYIMILGQDMGKNDR